MQQEGALGAPMGSRFYQSRGLCNLSDNGHVLIGKNLGNITSLAPRGGDYSKVSVPSMQLFHVIFRT